MPALLAALRTELETPNSSKRFGSGWLSGVGALLCGIVSLLLVISLRFPGVLATPQLAVVTDTIYFRVFLHAVLMFGYLFSLLCLLLRPNKLLAYAALGLVIVAGLIGGSGATAAEARSATIYFGLDFFVVNLLVTGMLFVPLERFFPKRPEQGVFRPEWNEDLFYYLVSSLIVQVVTYMSLAPSNFVNNHVPLGEIKSYIGSQPFLVQLFLVMLATDFAQYWLHRAFHRIPFLWQFHAVHHSARTLDWLAGGRMHILEVFALRGLTAVPMLTFGFEPGVVQTYVLLVYFYSAFLHANVVWEFGALERFAATPRFHHWHHAIEPEAVDVNFAIHFPLYDWLFGTSYMPSRSDRPVWPSGYGVGGDPVPRGYVPQFMHPFRWLMKRVQPAAHRN